MAKKQRHRRKRRGLSLSTRFRVLHACGQRCVYCGATAQQDVIHVDHVRAVAEGGGDEDTNLVAACERCNLGKYTRSFDGLTWVPPLHPWKGIIHEGDRHYHEVRIAPSQLVRYPWLREYLVILETIAHWFEHRHEVVSVWGGLESIAMDGGPRLVQPLARALGRARSREEVYAVLYRIGTAVERERLGGDTERRICVKGNRVEGVA